jgi:hypothetical protein
MVLDLDRAVIPANEPGIVAYGALGLVTKVFPGCFIGSNGRIKLSHFFLSFVDGRVG